VHFVKENGGQLSIGKGTWSRPSLLKGENYCEQYMKQDVRHHDVITSIQQRLLFCRRRHKLQTFQYVLFRRTRKIALVIAGFHHEEDDSSDLLGCYAAFGG
jgi:hypothetical protein